MISAEPTAAREITAAHDHSVQEGSTAVSPYLIAAVTMGAATASLILGWGWPVVAAAIHAGWASAWSP